MNLEKTLNIKIMGYMLNKLAALGLLVFIMCIYIILVTSFDLYEFTQYFSNLKTWGFISGYALLTTVLIDFVRYKWVKFTFKTSTLLHCLAGFIVFFPIMGIHLYSLIAGSVGAICAFIYAFSCYILEKNKQLVWIFLLVFPLLLCIRLIDFTVKENWSEERTKSSLSAEFKRFNGKNEIPISLKRGNEVTMFISFDQMNGGGYGYHVLDNNGELVGMKELEDTPRKSGNIDTNTIQFRAEEEGVYVLIVTGDNLKGKIDVKWEIK